MQGRDKKGRFAGKVAEDPKKCIRDAVDQFNRQCEKQNVVVVFARKTESQEPAKSDLPVEKKKVPEIPKNPDCKPATRSYVKHVGRVIFGNMQHKHESPGWEVLLLTSGLLLLFFFAVSVALALTPTNVISDGDIQLALVSVVITGMLFMASFTEVFGARKVIWKDDEIPRPLIEWEPPRQPKPRC